MSELAFYLFIAGAAILLGVYWLTRLHRREDRAHLAQPLVPVTLASTADAILLASGYGRITFANDHAREWFGLENADPDLELLAVRTAPSDAFRDLFAAEGRATLQIGHRWVAGASHLLPAGGERHMVVVLRDKTAEHADYSPGTAHALVMLSQIGQQVRKQAPLSETLDVILGSMAHALPFGAAQILRWDSEAQTLHVVARRGDADLLHALDRAAADARQRQATVGRVVAYREPLLVEYVSDAAVGMPFESYIAAPLIQDEELTGLVHLVHVEPQAFGPEDIALLGAVADQIIAAVEKAQLSSERSALAADLDALRALARAGVTAEDSRAFFAALTREIADAMRVEMCGIYSCDPTGQRLVPDRPFLGIPDAIIDALDPELREGTALHRVWLRDAGWCANRLDEENVVDGLGLRPYLEVLGMRRMALVPLVIGQQRIGMVQVANRRDGEDFDALDMQRLRTFAAQSAVVVESTRLLDEEARQETALSQLHVFSLAAGTAGDASEFYLEAAEQVAYVTGAEMAGVLLLNPAGDLLRAHESFYGAPAELVRHIQVPLAAGTPLTALWQEGASWLCNDLSHDRAAAQAGLDELTTRANMHQMLLAPMRVCGRARGALLLANKHSPTGFTEDDARLATIFAAQIAVIEQNAALQAEVAEHSRDVAFLRQIAATLTDPAPFDDLIQMTLGQAAGFFQSSIAAVSLLEQTTGELRILPQHVFGAALDAPITLDAYGTGFESSVVMSGRAVLSSAPADDLRLRVIYAPVIEGLDLRQVMIAPLRVGDQRLGELLVANSQRAYSRQDLETFNLIAAQLSAAVERLRLHTLTDRTLQARVGELNALDRVSNVLSGTVALEQVTHVIRQEALRVTPADECTVLLLHPVEEWSDVEQPEVLQRHGAEALFEGPAQLEEQVLRDGQPLMVADYAASPLDASPPIAVSALAVPIVFDGKPVGLIHLFAARPNVFSEQAETFVRALALKAATAYMNAAHFRDQISRNQLLGRRVEQLNQVFELGQMVRGGQELDDLLDAVVHAVQSAAGYAVVLLSLYDAARDGFRRVAQAGIPLATFEEIRHSVIDRTRIEAVLQDKFRISQSYFLPAEQAAEWSVPLGDDEIHYHQEYAQESGRASLWQPDDSLIVPLRDSRGTLLGIMSVDAPLDGRRPTPSALEPLEIFAQQAAIGVENHQLLEAVQREVEAARRERDVMQRLYAVSTEIQRAEDVHTRLQVVAQGIHDAGWQRVYITLRDEAMEPTTLVYSGYTDEEADELLAGLESGEVLRRWLADPAFYELRLGRVFYLRHDAPWVVEHAGGALPEGGRDVSHPAAKWHPDDRVLLPIFGAENRLIGLIGMESPASGNAPTESSLRPIELFANQAANAIEMTRLYQETSRAAEQEALFNRMMQAVIGTLDALRVVQTVAEGLQNFLPFTRLTTAVYDAANDWFDTLEATFTRIDRVTVAPGDPIPAEGSALRDVFTGGQGAIYALDDEEGDITASDLRQWWWRNERTIMLVPMMAGGAVVGAVHLGSDLSHAYGFDAETMAVVQRVVNLASVAMENARLYERTAERERFSAALVRLGNELNATLDLGVTLQSICRESLDIMAVEGAYIWQAEGGELVGITGVGPGSEAFAGQRIPIDDAHKLAARVFNDQCPLYVNQAAGQQDVTTALDDLISPRAFMGVPLLREGHALGVLTLLRVNSEVDFTAQDVEHAAIFATQAAMAFENARLYADARSRAGELHEQAQRLSLLNRVSTRLAQSLDIENIFEVALIESMQALDVPAARGVMFDSPRYGSVIMEVPRGDAPPANRIPLEGNAAVEQMRRERIPLIVEDAASSPLLEAMRGSFAAREAAAVMLVPLLIGEQVIGMLMLESPEARTFTPEQTALAQTIAGQAAIAAQNANLLEQSYIRTRELETLFEASQTMSLTRDDVDEVIQGVAYQMLHALGAGSSAVMLWDEAQQAVVVRADVSLSDRAQLVPGMSLPLDEYPQRRHVLETREIVLITPESDEVAPEEVAEMGAAGSQMRLLVPLVMREHAIGLACVDLMGPTNRFGVSEQRIATTLAGQSAIAIENARLTSELRRFNQQLESRVRERSEEVLAERDRLNVLYTITAELSATLDMDRVLSRALDLLAKAVGADDGLILLIDHQQDLLYKRAELGVLLQDPDAAVPLRPTEGLSGWVIQNRQSVVVDDVQADPRWIQLAPHHRLPRAAMAVLLETSDDVLGVMMLYSTRVGVFTDAHLRLAAAAGNQLATSINNAELYLFIREQAERLGDLVREQQVEASKTSAMLEGVADGVMFADQTGKVTLFNNAAERVLGISRREIVGRPMLHLSGLFGGGAKRWAAAVSGWMRDPNAISPDAVLSEMLDVQNRVISVTLAPVSMYDQFLGTVAVFRDITREVEVDRLKTEFISNVSHELRTPMTSIKGYADLLMLGAAGEINERQREFLATMKANADRLSTLVDDLLNISHIDSGQMPMKPARVDLGHIARMALGSLQERIQNGRKQIEAAGEIAEDLPETAADGEKLSRVLANLLDNAYQYTPDGGRITLSVRMDGANQFLITVRDTGIGIPEWAQARVFDRFFRNDEHPLVIETPGTGLGLSLVRELVEMHQGRVWLESVEGQGTTFYVALPLVEVEPAASVQADAG